MSWSARCSFTIDVTFGPVAAGLMWRARRRELGVVTVPFVAGSRRRMVLADGRSKVHERWQLVGRHEEVARALDALHGSSRRGVVIHGPAGVGKSRLAAELVDRAAAEGRDVIRARATMVSASMPFGALVHLLPAGVLSREDPVGRYREIVEGLPRRDGLLVVLVDDLQYLDAASVALLAQLLDGGEVFLVGTVRSETAPAPTVASLWRRDDVVRIDLGDLSRDDVDTLLHVVLGGPVHSDAVASIWSASRGNALFVRELVLGAKDAGDLAVRRGVWWLRGSLSSTPRLTDVVDDRVRAVSDEARDGLELLAVWEPLGLTELESVVGAGPIEELDRAGLLDVGLDGRRQPVRLVHPLYGEVIRGGLAALTTRRLLLAGADRIEAFGARRRGDQLRVAVARVDAAGTADPQLLLAAARIARQSHDYPLVERLTRLADRAVVSTEQILLRAEALHELGDFEEVERLLVETVPDGGPDLAVRLVALRVRNLMWGLQRPADALAVNRQAREQQADPALLDELITDEALTLLHSNHPDEALLALSTMSPQPAPRALILRSIAEIPSLTAIGRCETALGLVDEAYVAHTRLDDPSVIAHPGIHIVYKLEALLEAGRLVEAEELAGYGYERTRREWPADRPDMVPLGTGTGRPPRRPPANGAAMVVGGRRAVDGQRVRRPSSPPALPAGSGAGVARGSRRRDGHIDGTRRNAVVGVLRGRARPWSGVDHGGGRRSVPGEGSVAWCRRASRGRRAAGGRGQAAP